MSVGKKLLILDFDGTIVKLETDWQLLKNSLRDYCRQKFQIFESFDGLDSSLAKIRAMYGDSLYRDLLEMVAQAEIEGYKGRKNNTGLNNLFPDKTLKRAIFSKNCHKTVETILLEIDFPVDFIVAKEDVDKPKPNPEGINKILSHFALKPSEAIFVGNEKVDMEAGARAGVETILIQ